MADKILEGVSISLPSGFESLDQLQALETSVENASKASILGGPALVLAGVMINKQRGTSDRSPLVTFGLITTALGAGGLWLAEQLGEKVGVFQFFAERGATLIPNPSSHSSED